MLKVDGFNFFLLFLENPSNKFKCWPNDRIQQLVRTSRTSENQSYFCCLSFSDPNYRTYSFFPHSTLTICQSPAVRRMFTLFSPYKYAKFGQTCYKLVFSLLLVYRLLASAQLVRKNRLSTVSVHTHMCIYQTKHLHTDFGATQNDQVYAFGLVEQTKPIMCPLLEIQN